MLRESARVTRNAIEEEYKHKGINWKKVRNGLRLLLSLLAKDLLF